MNIKDKILNLISQIEKANFEYYNLDKPSLSDFEYDSIMKELKDLENQYPEHIYYFSPTQRVGATPISKFQKVSHKFKMLSLDNAFNSDDLDKFYSDVNKVASDSKVKKLKFVLEPKIDGLSISIIYKKGLFFQALTRGNGVIGEDVSQNIKTVSSIPLRISNNDEYFEVRGEVYISFSNFKLVNQNNEKEGREILMNPRNAASGSIRNLDPNVAKQRKLSVFLYNIPHQIKGIDNQWDTLHYLEEMGFTTPLKFCKLFSDFNLLKDYAINFDKSNLNFPIDGLVIKYNDFILYDEIGYTSKFPKWAIAYKFSAEIVQTKIKNIFPTVGRTGKITYNAELVPVEINQTIVKSATLHNYNYIIDNDIRINDIVEIYKAGEIIPKVIGPVLPRINDNTKWEYVQNCPSCESFLKFNETGNEQFCTNDECRDINIQKIVHFCSKESLNIEGLGESLIERLYDKGYIRKIADIFSIYSIRDELIQMERMGEKSADNLISSIDKTKSSELEKWIFAIGIPNMGKKTSKTLAKKFKSIYSIMKADISELESVEDFGPIIANSIYNYFRNEENLNVINFLISIGFKTEISTNNVVFKESIFYEKNILITGTFDWISRNEIMNKIEKEYKGYVLSSKSKKINYLIMGENPGSKKEWAIQNNIEIIDSERLLLIFNS